MTSLGKCKQCNTLLVQPGEFVSIRPCSSCVNAQPAEATYPPQRNFSLLSVYLCYGVVSPLVELAFYVAVEVAEQLEYQEQGYRLEPH